MNGEETKDRLDPHNTYQHTFVNKESEMVELVKVKLRLSQMKQKGTTFQTLSDLPPLDNYLELNTIEKLRYRDSILKAYLHIPQRDMLETLVEDMNICVYNEEFEVAKAYLDLINDLKTLDLLR